MRRRALCSVALLSLISVARAAPDPHASDRARELHFQSIVVDTHDDTTQRLLDPRFDLGARQAEGSIDIPRARQGGLDAIFFSIYLPGTVTRAAAVERALTQIAAVRRQVEQHRDELLLATTAADIRRAVSEGKIAVLMGIEGGHMIGNDLANLRRFHAVVLENGYVPLWAVIIRKANRDRTPLVPVSSGTNLQDTHLPSVKGATAVDLSRLNKITYFDARNRNAVIQPGVTFSQLEQACAAEGLRTLAAIDVPRHASVLATYLEMMPLFSWPKYHPWEMLTMKGFRADGEDFATGQMAMSQKRPDKYSWGSSLAQRYPASTARPRARSASSPKPQ